MPAPTDGSTAAPGTEAPADTVSQETVPGPAALTVVGTDGIPRWEAAPTAGFTVAMQAVVGGGVVVASTFCDGPVAVKAWDAQDGTPLWSAVVPGSIGGAAALAVEDGEVLVTSAGGLQALDLQTGDQRWQTDATLWGARAGTVLASPLSGSDTDVSILSGLDADSGAARWTVTIPDGGSLAGLAADGERAYATVDGAGGSVQLIALGLADGAELWRSPVTPGSDRTSVEAVGGVAVGWPVDVTDVATAALDGATGAEQWRVGSWGLPQQAAGLTSSGDGNVYVTGFGSTPGVAALDATDGTLRWSSSLADLGGATLTTVGAVPGGYLVVVDGQAILLGAGDGGEQWRVAPPGGLLGAGDDLMAFAPECPNLGA